MKPIRSSLRFTAILSLCFALFTLPTLASADLTRVHYPDQTTTSFTVDVPSDWTLTPQGAEGAEDYFYVSSDSVELAFRTIDGADIEAAVDAHVAYLKENFTDLQLGKAVETNINGMGAMILPAVGTDSEGSVRELGSGWFRVSDSTLGELWYNADKASDSSKTAASAVLNSLRNK